MTLSLLRVNYYFVTYSGTYYEISDYAVLSQYSVA